MAAGSPAPPKRADAERNRAKILAAAQEAFSEPGGEPSMAEIARRAGVGMATLYRNFPGRFDLLAALYGNQVDAICQAAETAVGRTPGEMFFAWLEQFHAVGARKGPLASLLLAEPAGGASVINDNRARVYAAGEVLFAAARDSGEVRDDLPLPQILDAIVAVGQIPDDPAFPGRIVQVVFDGLRRMPT
ncbi:TetR/AcrR family transcriptional regulator [Micromonospora gifhornensis]|uniref:TetR/AcrR family transcriptional regulator n=1 Tax=Micromonospora TaxID=1873 RepID=UPI000F85EBA8|nr:TetR/AcrR family transcriptional regulator [Verrucosispora sp. FIM060022]RUL92533.1 TetR/AcrR family transcriptional regulator [Verrucosispora sp. FIM060022]